MFLTRWSADQLTLHCRLGQSADSVGPISNTRPPTLGNMVFGLCRGAWPYKGPCTAGGKLAAEALRVLKKSIQHAGARRRGWGAAPLSQLRRALALAWWEKGAGHKAKTERGQVRQVAWLALPTLNGS